MAYWRLMFKCLRCNFHFVGLTWHKDKWIRRWINDGNRAFCPECGKQDTFLFGAERKDGEIFEVCGARAVAQGGVV